ncbi:putative transcription regulator [Heterobasidion irregulare TC 32-1]|uniref:Putative transcription regulator n=1 Tax=Heterobasidion irregulare (strain TC 32-1) TaxID=747525 RepID=W4KE31_HETIT|nr:putative transcription regulator [Heterobasidion irregulare TC 32-1]ETW83575.1 putative transcription regulator [Heterobasidion irregulare TC 32-1]
MATSATAAAPTTTILGKRKATQSYIIHLSASDVDPDVNTDTNTHLHTDGDAESSYASDAAAGPSASKNGRQNARRTAMGGERAYRCVFEGCGKAYTKPSRLAEHARSHTGHNSSNPWIVASLLLWNFADSVRLAPIYMPLLPQILSPRYPSRRTRAHAPLHFCAPTPVRRGRMRKALLDTAAPERARRGHSQGSERLRAEHAPPGSKPYLCTHSGCTKSFATAQKLRAHAKVHDGQSSPRHRPSRAPNKNLTRSPCMRVEKRYTCVHPGCLAPVALPALSSDPAEPAYFPTWTALQHHIRTAHPPMCPRASCDGRTFASHAGLRAHLKVHADADAEAGEDRGIERRDSGGQDSGDDEENRLRKRRRGGELGRDWKCEEDRCGKDFKSKKALTTHHTITHLGRRDFVCPEIGCARAFGYKHILQRHVARVHVAGREQGEVGDADADEEYSDADGAQGGPSGIDAMTGRLYAQRAAAGDSGTAGASIARLRRLRCPYPNLRDFSLSSSPSQPLQAACEYVFGRAYDLRRHMGAVHGVVLEKETVDAWARRVRAGLARGS